MTTIQKAFVATTLALAVGVGVYEHQVISQQQEQLTAAQQESANLRAQMRQLQRERDNATARWAAMQTEIDAARARLTSEEHGALTRDAATESEMKAVLDRVAELKRRIAELPGPRARASGLLTMQDWIKLALDTRLDTEDAIKKALAAVQDQVKVKWADMVQTALGKYAAANAGMLPTDCAELAPFLPPGTDTSILQRFQMLRAGNFNDMSGSEWLVADIGAVEDENETLVVFGRGMMMWGDDHDRRLILRAFVDFTRTHNGQPPNDAAQLQPLLRRPIDAAKLQEFWKQNSHALR